jgi:hypothetical protein
VRRENPQRHPDDHAHEGGKQHLRQGLHGLLPIAQVEDQQKRQRHKHRQPPFALDDMRQQGDQPDKDKRVEPGQRKRHAVDHRFQ